MQKPDILPCTAPATVPATDPAPITKPLNAVPVPCNGPFVLQRNRVTVKVPATSANLGPGFDCLGLALDIWNELTVEQSSEQSFEIIGEGAASLPTDERNLVLVGMKAAFKVGLKLAAAPVLLSDSNLISEACKSINSDDIQLPPLRYICVNRIPFSRGLGSSSAAVVSGLIAGLVLTGVELPMANDEALFNFACAIEGHPDNVAPAIYGGLQIGVQYVGDDGISKWTTSHISVPNGLQCVLFLPNQQTTTKTARAILPSTFSRTDVVFNISRVALLVNSLASGRLHNLKIAMDDRLHQPHREAAAGGTHIRPIIEAAIRSGAHAACLSGSGPAVLAITSGARGDIFTQKQGERMDVSVANGMLSAAKAAGIEGRVFITHPSIKGAHVVSASPPFSEGQVKHYGGCGDSV